MHANDAEALPLLIEAMQAAADQDAPAALEALADADAALTPRRPGAQHKSRADIAAATQAATDATSVEDWQVVWRHAWAATTGLTWAFPPDPAICPPMPRDADDTATAATCACGQPLPAIARFCPMCGVAVG